MTAPASAPSFGFGTPATASASFASSGFLPTSFGAPSTVPGFAFGAPAASTVPGFGFGAAAAPAFHQSPVKAVKASKASKGACFKCGSYDHWARDCPGSDGSGSDGGDGDEDEEEEEEEEGSVAYSVEYAKSNRAQCRSCGNKIDKNVLRFGVSTNDSDYGYSSCAWHHVDCLDLASNKFTADECSGLKGLKPADQQKVRSLLGR